jgi:tRNA-specific 2-thiouridylase
MNKAEVRAQARKLALPVSDKPDCQDICFVPSGRYSDVIERLRPGATEAGEIVHVDGRVLGQHKGIINFTIGQRRGLGIAGPDPLYVVRLDPDRREVVVGPRDSLQARLIMLRNVNWLGDSPLADVERGGLRLHVRVRSSQAPQPATLFAHDGCTAVLLHEGEYGIAAGQACVFYADGSAQSRVLGGGWIVSARPAADHASPETASASDSGRTPVSIHAVHE